MKVNVGSTNEVKVKAVIETIKDYNLFINSEVNSVNVKSEVSEQPISLDETIKGAMNRAKNAFQNCDYSLGIESGLMKVPNTKTGYMDVCVCAIFDGKNFHIGLSSAFEYPTNVVKFIFEEGMDATQAFNKIGLTKNPKIGSSEGAIGILTKGRLIRKEFTKQAIVNALIHLEFPELFYIRV